MPFLRDTRLGGQSVPSEMLLLGQSRRGERNRAVANIFCSIGCALSDAATPCRANLKKMLLSKRYGRQLNAILRQAQIEPR